MSEEMYKEEVNETGEMNNNDNGNDGAGNVIQLSATEQSAQQQALEKMKPVLSGIPREKLLSQSVPVRVLTEEGVMLERCARRDEKPLRAAGMDWSLVEALTPGARALSEAQSQWDNVRFSRADAQCTLRTLLDRADTLRSQLVHTMRFAYRHDDELVARVNRIADGTGRRDLIQDLNDLAVLGRANTTQLTMVGMSLELLSEAAGMSDAVRVQKADATVNESIAVSYKLLRDQAYTHLKATMDTIREYGQFVFWKSSEQFSDYSSAYLREIRKRNRHQASKTEVVESEVLNDKAVETPSEVADNTPDTTASVPQAAANE